MKKQACTPHRLTLLSLCLGTALAAHAQDGAKPAAEQLDTILVTGQAASLRSALAKQQAAQGIVNIVHADAIGQLPDNNAAEALARLPGVSVERDQGEGRFIRVRGLGPDYNAVNINGALTPATQSDRRAPGLDLVPAGLIRALEVSKTALPEQDGNSLGGTVTVRTLSAFDQPGRLFSVELGANHDANAGKTRPRGSLTYADRFADGRLGLALALSSDERRFASDNVETGGAWDGSKLESFEQRRYEITRKRVGGALNLDFKPDAQSLIYLRSFSSRFTDQEQRQSVKYAFDSAQAAGETGTGTVTRGLKAREEVNKSSALVLGGELTRGAWKSWLEAGAGRASEAKPDTIASSAFTASFSGLGFSNGQRPQPIAVDGVDSAANYAFSKAKLEPSSATDRVRHLKADLQRAFEAGDLDIELKAGVKATRRDKDNEQETYAPTAKLLLKSPYSYTTDQLNLSQFSDGDISGYAWGSLGPAISTAKLRSLFSGLSLSDFRDDVDSQTNDFRMQEDSDAGYLQAKIERGGTQLVTGLRHERVRFTADGYSAVDDEISAVHYSSKQAHWLPALLLRQELGGNTQLRAALTRSVVRPSFAQLSPGRVIDGDEATIGNPDLKPLRASNLDLGVEHRLARDGAVSAYLFHKKIRDFAFQTDLAGSTGWEDFSTVTSYANGQDASVSGLELSYNQALRGLPAPFNGLVLGANASFVHSKAQIGGYSGGSYASRSISLPSQSDRSVNVSLGWEGYGLSTRLALNHKSPYLLEVGDVADASKDQYVDTQNQIDFSASYQFSKRWQISFEALNLSNERYYVYQADKARNVQYEQYGRSFKVGLKLAVY